MNGDQVPQQRDPAPTHQGLAVAVETVFKVFLSSIAEDLKVHRDRAGEVVESMGLLPVRMETFGARPKPPVIECRKQAATSGVAVIIVAHRYGWVPSIAEGGDGKKSITWIEIDAALQAGVEVLAFLVDPEHRWSEHREQDDLLTTSDEASALAVWRRVQQLAAFKQFLERGFVRDRFTTPDDLARKVVASLHNWLKERQPMAPAPIVGPRSNLLARTDFVGREKEKVRVLDALASRAAVVLIDGIGGIGKTALALDVAHLCLEASRGSTHGQVPYFASFVWASAKDRQLRLEDLLDTIARTLGVPHLTRRSIEDRKASVQHLLAQEPCLLIGV
jgi:hypothetical protein